MSEYIDNVARRKEILKNVLKQLHEGRSVEEVKAEFSVLAKEAGSAEIAEIEQMLINEGLPVEEIQNLCDVHVALFRDGLEQQTAPEMVPGHPVFTFHAENQLLSRSLNALRDAVDHYQEDFSALKLQALRSQTEKLKLFNRHYLRKENLLFPYLEKYGFSGPAKVMWGIHDQVRVIWKDLEVLLAKTQAADSQEVQSQFKLLDNTMREMIYKEEKILFPAAISHLSDTDWASIRSQEAELGYFLLTPSSQWQPAAAPTGTPASTIFTSPVHVSAGELPLDTGLLTLEQINLMVRNLPVDVTFVDENDTVRFFSQTKERIFERQAAIIGRKVQNCHPPQSVSRVQKILDDFRAGQRDTAEFWIQMGGKFVYIRYLALHDASGKYRGTLEVTQDLTHLRELQGERRLLDDSK
jgi:uncharacterized protein